MLIGKFQLENLLSQNIPFLFIRLDDELSVPDTIMSKTQFSPTPSELLSDQSKEAPIILICKSGAAAQNWQSKLEDQGFINVYAVEKGEREFD